MLDLRRLQLLCELGQRGTIAATARAMGYTHSAVSQQLSALEREAGVVLLERDGRRVVLTPAARALAARVQHIIDDLNDAVTELRGASTTVRGEVRLGSFPSAAHALIAPMAHTLATAHPDVRLAFLEVDPDEGIHLLRSDALDVLVCYEYDLLTPLPDGGMESIHLLDDPVLVALPADHPRASAAELDIADLSGEPWIAGLTGTPFGSLVQRACRAVGFEPRIVHRAREFSVQETLVGAGLGLALLPDLGRGNDTTGVRFVALRSPAIVRRVHAVVRRGSQQRPVIRATLRELVRAAQAQPTSDVDR